MSSQDWVRFLTEEFMRFIHTPRSERRQQKMARKEQRGSLSYHWFGILPTAFSMVFRRIYHVSKRMADMFRSKEHRR